jgi:hypothetical protein
MHQLQVCGCGAGGALPGQGHHFGECAGREARARRDRRAAADADGRGAAVGDLDCDAAAGRERRRLARHRACGRARDERRQALPAPQGLLLEIEGALHRAADLRHLTPPQRARRQRPLGGARRAAR